jgi:hypothetical protein
VIFAVTGGRYTAERKPIQLTTHQLSTLKSFLLTHGVHKLVHGAAEGTDLDIDRALRVWIARGDVSLEIEPYPVRTSLDGPWPMAGKNRNGRMLDKSKAEGLIVMPGQGGTMDCMCKALDRGLRVWKWDGDADTGRLLEITR